MAGWYRKGKGPDQPYLYLGLHTGQNAWRAIWDGQHLLSELDYQLLYDYQSDPHELINLYDDPDHQKLKEELRYELMILAAQIKDPILRRLKQIKDK